MEETPVGKGGEDAPVSLWSNAKEKRDENGGVKRLAEGGAHVREFQHKY